MSATEIHVSKFKNTRRVKVADIQWSSPTVEMQMLLRDLSLHFMKLHKEEYFMRTLENSVIDFFFFLEDRHKNE